MRTSLLFRQSQTQYAPGYEASSIEADPQFRQFGGKIAQTRGEDLRLRAESPTRRKGIVLPADLRSLDPLAPRQGRPDIGCYEFDKPGLRVGVDGRRHFPLMPEEVLENTFANLPAHARRKPVLKTQEQDA